MFSKPLTVSQHKKNKQHKKKLIKKTAKLLCKNEEKILSNIANNVPEDIVKLLFSFVNNNIKFNLSHHKELFSNFIFNYNDVNILPVIFRGYTTFNYCTHEKTALPLKEMLSKIPLDKLQKYLYFGTPSKYFNIAFPHEPKIQEYITINYPINDITSKNEKYIQSMYKNYIFEVLDLISYFSTQANLWHAFHCNDKCLSKNKYLSQLNFINNVYNYDDYNKQTEEQCKENEKITKKFILSIIYIFEKFGKRSKT
jgi:hypothetical protein